MDIRSFFRTLRDLVVGPTVKRPVRPPRPGRRPVRRPRIWAASLQTRAATPFTPPPTEPPEASPQTRSPFVRVAVRVNRVWSPGLSRHVLAPAGADADTTEQILTDNTPEPVPPTPQPEPEPEPQQEPEAESAPQAPEEEAAVQNIVVQGEGQRYFSLTPELGVARLLDGHFVYVDPLDEAVGAHLIARGYWESWIHQVVCDLVQPGDRIIEVGANFGVYTLAMARIVGESGFIDSFEANPDLAALVERSVKFNGYAPRVRMIPKAASSEPGEVSFVVSRRNAGGGTLSTDPNGLGDGGQLITVPAVRLDDECDVRHVRLLRMDAEGSEPLILRGAVNLLGNPNLVVIMEWDVIQMRSRADLPEFVEWLSSMGYRFWRIQYDSTLLEVPAEDMPQLSAGDVVMSRQPPPGARLTAAPDEPQTSDGAAD